MPAFLSSTTRIAICDRCRFKVPYDELRPDGNSPGLRVCGECYDEIDPYKLPARKTEKFTLKHARPDTSLGPIDKVLSDADQDIILVTNDGADIVIGEQE
jgi:hypothetical protein